MSNNFISNGNNRKEEQHFFLNSKEIYGIQSAAIGYQQNLVPLKFLGMGEVASVPNGPQKGNLHLDTLVIDNDHFLSLSGVSGFNGYLVKSRSNYQENFSFESGYLTSYNSKCSVGEIPQISVDVTVFGNAGRFSQTTSPEISGQLNQISANTKTLTPVIAGPGSISLDIDDFSTNRVLSYDLTYEIERNPIYPLGTRIPNIVQTNFPISVTLAFQFALNNYAAQEMFDYPNNPTTKNINLTLKKFSDDSTIISYDLPEMTLIQEQQNAGVQGQTIINAVYKGYIGQRTATSSSNAITNLIWQGYLYAYGMI